MERVHTHTHTHTNHNYTPPPPTHTPITTIDTQTDVHILRDDCALLMERAKPVQVMVLESESETVSACDAFIYMLIMETVGAWDERKISL